MSGDKPAFEPLADMPSLRDASRRRIRSQQQQLESELRGSLMAADRVLANKTIKELAGEYSISPSTVRTEIDLAYAKGFRDRFESMIWERIVPPAIAVYEAHLNRGNLDAARDILFGLGVLKKDHKSVADATPATVDTIEAYRVIRKSESPS